MTRSGFTEATALAMRSDSAAVPEIAFRLLSVS